MKNVITKIAPKKAALVVGMAFISSVILVTLIDDFILGNFVIPGDTMALAHDIEAIGSLFGVAALDYLIVLILDTVIGLALYVVLRPANRNLALLTSGLRILYAFTVGLGVLLLVFKMIDVYSYASIKLIGYIFFALHILLLGYTVLKANYIPNILGVLLILASFTYSVFYIDVQLPESLMVMIMLLMAIAELALSIWLLVKRNTLPLHTP